MRIAAAQTAPVWGDPEATAERVIQWIHRAAEDGVDLVAFGETFLSGYPFWVARTDGARWDDDDQKSAYAFYLKAAVGIDGPELQAVSSAVAETGVFTYLGVTERSSSRGTIYATLVGIDPSNGIVSAHRKLTPTYEERLVWGTGDGHGLQVHDLGRARVGGLNCWENWVPTARHALYAQGMDLHIAAWPGSVELTEDITRFIAKEGRCFVLSAGALLRPQDIPSDFPLREAALAGDGSYFYNGGSAVAGPDGNWIQEPVAGEERLVVANIDVAAVRGERQNFDAAGHYFRGDVFEVTIDRRRLDPATFAD
ncbi:MAG TPA: carbon-nitrogen hydrolase family protein [Acidimicrobiia bacterium]|nr:carbon-nitrogen hydrolase family protein [Acidimicrobiia bacterium]